MKVEVWISRLLWAFVLVTVGFALGRGAAPRALPLAREGSAISGGVNGGADKLMVYSVHMTFRCRECNQIEWLTRELLDKEFAEELAAGRIEYRVVDYMRDVEFARRYDIAASTLVLARVEKGREVDFARLDEVWTKARDREEFMSYVRGRIRAQLARLSGDGS